jgi:hypothetical protein
LSSKYTVQANPNPFAPPTVMRNLPGAAGFNVAGLEKLRRDYLAHESAIAAFGWFFTINGWFILAGFLINLVLMIWLAIAGNVEINWAFQIGRLMGNLLVGVYQIFAGTELRKLKNAGRGHGTFLSIFFILYGIGIWFMILVWSEKGNKVFSDEYRSAVHATPYIKRHMTVTAWILIFWPIFMTLLLIGLFVLLGLIVIAATNPASL